MRGEVKVIASIEDPAVIGKILGHRASRELPAGGEAAVAGSASGAVGVSVTGSDAEARVGFTTSGVAGCAGGGQRCTYPGATERFAGPWRPGSWAGRLSSWVFEMPILYLPKDSRLARAGPSTAVSNQYQAPGVSCGATTPGLSSKL